jgi:outer membrane protein insertion porin family
MTRNPLRRRLLSLALAAALSGPVAAQNIEPFTVADIRVEGLQRITPGTVFTYLQIERGERVDGQAVGRGIRDLYQTGFFSDVRFERQGDILVITVIERPAINTISLVGNKDIKTDDLLRGLREIGLAEGETYNPLNLDRITQELTRQYNNRGKYDVTIEPTVTDLDRNRVDISIVINEGRPARISDINIVGNEDFSDRQLRDNWESRTSNWFSWYNRDDQYSRERFAGDLEKLANFYLDRGYIDFNVESTQVAISPDRENMFLTASISEGEIYKISEVSVSGDTVLPQATVEALVFIKPGDVFSRRQLEAISELITQNLSNIGYANAQVNPIPEIDRENRTVGINFFVEPGPRVQVRRIVFRGNSRTADEVLRRELRQFEGAWYSQSALDRSKIRLMRLGFFDEVNIDSSEVAGSPDQVDVVITVKERNSGQFVFGLGYSQLAGLITTIQLNQINFLGTGNRLGLTVQNNIYSKRFNLAFTNPYFTDDGVSVGYNLNYTDFDQGDFNTARYTSSNSSAEVIVGIPIAETDNIQLAMGLDRVALTTTDGSTPPQLVQYLVDTMGDRERFPLYHVNEDNDDNTPIENDDADPSTEDTPISIPGLSTGRQWVVNAWRLQAGWARDSRNNYLLPTAGTYHRVNAEVVLPGSDLEYYRLSYDFEHYRPLTNWLVLKVSAELGYGDSYGETGDAACIVVDDLGIPTTETRSCGMPFFRNFYAGGVQSVRGFEANSLGPRYRPDQDDGFYQPLGGSLKTVGTFEVFFPRLFRSTPGTRLSLFMDWGNVYSGTDDFDAGDLRVSAGVSLQWQSPMGPLSISYAVPLRYNRGTLIDPDGVGGSDPFLIDVDRIERLQFTFQQGF